MDYHQSQNHDQSGPKQAAVVLIMVPFPAQGHLNQLMEMSCLIWSYNIPVQYVGSAIHSCQVKLRVRDLDTLQITNLHFHDFPIPSFPSPPPNPCASMMFPAHLQPSFEASLHLRQPITALLHQLSPIVGRIIVVHDALMASVVQDTASIPNAEAYTFHSISAFTNFCFIWEAMGKPFPVEAKISIRLPSIEGCFTLDIMNFMAYQHEFHMKFNSGGLYNTCRSIEGTYMDLLAKEQMNGNKKQWAIGPLNPVVISKCRNSNRRHKCLDWLDKQAAKSVIFISFGTTTSMADEQIKELAIGLEQSKRKFIWVLREADKGDVSAKEVRKLELPKEFEERVKGVGMVVRDWAPQLEIFGHLSTWGFMSHCGWNSCMESISMGVQIAAWPIHSDQPRNTFLVTELMKVGMVVKQWTGSKELVTSGMIEKAVRRLMESEEGNEIRKRAEALVCTVRQSVAEGGISCMELDSFISHITK